MSLCCSVGYEKLHCQSSLSECPRGPFSLRAKSLPTLALVSPTYWSVLNNEKLFSKWHLLSITECGGVCGGKFLRILLGNVSYQPGRFLVSSLLLLFQIINGKNNRNRKYLQSPNLRLVSIPNVLLAFSGKNLIM